MRIRSSVGASAVLAAFVSGCATTRYEEYGPPPEASAPGSPGPKVEVVSLDSTALSGYSVEERLARLETVLLMRISDLEAEGSGTEVRLRALSEQVAELRSEILRRDSLQTAAPAGRSQTSARARPPAPPPGKEPVVEPAGLNRLYEQALADFDRQHYAAAKKRLAELLSRSPNGDLADNACYWLGECAYAEGSYDEALQSFQRVFQFGQTEKDDDAQLKLGYCYLKLGETESALIEFKRLVIDYPKSEYVGRAEEQIRRLRPGASKAP